MIKDYYKILGVSKTATPEEIKKRYRKLAVKYHPDRHNGDPQMNKKFKEISEAYSVLNSPEKRRKYDQGDVNFNFSDFDFTNIFTNIFNKSNYDGDYNSFNSKIAIEPDIFVKTEINIFDFYHDSLQKISFKRTSICDRCNGTLKIFLGVCKSCKGTGQTNTMFQTNFFFSNTCEFCQGTGRRYERCKLCNTGTTFKNVEIEYRPKKNYLKEKIIIKNAGNWTGYRYGNLIITPHIVETIDYEFYKNSKKHILQKIIVCFEEVLGLKQIKVMTISKIIKKFYLKPPFTTSTLLRVKNGGLKYPNQQAGDLYLQLELKIPTIKEIKQIIKKV